MKRVVPAVLIFGLSGLAIVLGCWFVNHPWDGAQKAATFQREIATRIMGEYLSHHFRGQPVLVVSNPFTQRSGLNSQIYRSEEAELNGLRNGIGRAASIKVVFPELRPNAQQDPQSAYVDPKTTTPLSFLITDRSLDSLVRGNPECAIIVTLIGLPVNLEAVEAWKKEGNPKFALFLPDWRMVGNKAAIRSAFLSGKIVAAVINKPGAPADDSPVKGPYKEEFSKRFLLVTAENIESLLQTSPQLF